MYIRDNTSIIVGMKVNNKWLGAMNQNNKEFLEPSELCDFDKQPEIRLKALEISNDCAHSWEALQRIFTFVKELPYGLDDWHVTASEVLAKGWGMCSGKTNLLVAMLRSVNIPARYRIYRVKAEAGLWSWMSGDKEMSNKLGDVPAQQDHVDCEVWLEEWKVLDPGRDTLMEKGLSVLGIPLEREPVCDEAGRINYFFLANFDEWAKNRQAQRKFRHNRTEVFGFINEQLWQIRALAQNNAS